MGKQCADVKTMNVRTRKVDAACCPHPNSCPNGLPTQCSAECALELGPFITDCAIMIKVAMPTMMPKMQAVNKGCAHQDANALIVAIAKRECCGDGTKNGKEECDDGSRNANTPDSCRPTCKKPRCGDHIVDTKSGEQCDEVSAVCNVNCQNSE